MKMQNIWSAFVAAAIVSLGVAHAASPSAPPAGAAPATTPATAPAATGQPASATPEQRGFASADAAVTALVAALRDNNETDLRAILGPEAHRVIDSGDRYADQELRARFLALYDEKHALVETAPGHMELDAGANDWPMPIPIVESGGQWRFDTAAGAQTIVDRRIGRNELMAIRTLLACEDAQRDFFERTKKATGTGAYAMRLVSTPGHQDGLYLARRRRRRREPVGPADRYGARCGLSGGTCQRSPDPVRGLLLPHPACAGPGWRRRREKLRARRPHDRRLRNGRLAREVRVRPGS